MKWGLTVTFCFSGQKSKVFNCSYDSSTGVFTVPPGGDGLYYFSTYLSVDLQEIAHMDIQVNDESMCSARGDHQYLQLDSSHASCSAVVDVVTGNSM